MDTSYPIQILSPADCGTSLGEIAQPPERLYIKGEAQCLRGAQLLAVVGTRKPSSYGLRAAHFFSRELVEAGFTLVSGLARGIDSVAHTAAVLGKRPTIAILGHGLDRIYPSENRRLADEILECGGCLVSEYPEGVPPQAHHFPERNRIISGLVEGVLVIEAGAKSGSLITARHALEQNREVFIVPGPFFEEGFRGSHWLLKQGAKAVVDCADIYEDLRGGVASVSPKISMEADSDILRALFRKRGVATLEQLLQELSLTPAETGARLEAALEQGWVRECGPQKYVYAGK